MAKQTYTQEFKEQAVKLSYEGDKGVPQLAADLGVATNMLYRWRREFEEGQVEGGAKKAFPGRGRERDVELEGLRKALRQAEQERDILKKAVAFFAKQSK
jgi:transposase